MTYRNTRSPPSPQAGWAYFLDVDGTLIDLAISPDAIEVDRHLLALLDTVYRKTGGALALVSGRSVADLDRHIGLSQVPRAGQQGLERRDAKGKLRRHVTSEPAKQAMLKALEPVLARHSGLLLEDKGMTLAVHYRQVPRLGAYVHRFLGRLVEDMGRGFHLQVGKRVVEVKPVGVDKGTAVAAYLAEAPFAGRTPVFVGDDANDEHAFALVNERGGVSIKVGAGRSCAHYRLPDVASVRAWLAGLLTHEALP
ncbi:trehalose-phosphatase [Denitratisoma sp. DHT3]|uniref:trehalose-phosphatase n=1 Tax=Denitratisoma sp. DHT3 TaxID=1981880 RepID=UPI0011988FFB|nr:trehalose-phosphatase [Denitratisoma sp. DHT3]QDX79993.1 trehalose-phosphatase [Denitratisoma sp. DHT3]